MAETATVAAPNAGAPAAAAKPAMQQIKGVVKQVNRARIAVRELNVFSTHR